MKYMGSKNRHAKELLPIILKDRGPEQCYVEPFVGGCNMIDKVEGYSILNDKHSFLIKMWQAVGRGWTPPDFIGEGLYHEAKNNVSKLPPELIGYIGFSMSFGGKWFGGYRRDKAGTKGCIENMKTQSRRSYNAMLKQAEKLQDVIFYNVDYWMMYIPLNSIIYCDPPYAGTTKYKDGFDHDTFWQWCREMVRVGHTVFISEYNAPEDFECVWEKTVNNTLTKDTGSKQGIEKLFIYGE